MSKSKEPEEFSVATQEVLFTSFFANIAEQGKAIMLLKQLKFIENDVQPLLPTSQHIDTSQLVRKLYAKRQFIPSLEDASYITSRYLKLDAVQ